jgi:hypothetical protein
MGMHLFKIGFFGVLMLFGAIAIFLGAVTGYAALQSGELTFVSGAGGQKFSNTVSRLADPSGFWRGGVLPSVLPVIGGVAALWFGRRGLNRI